MALKSFAARHPVAAYFALAYGIAWTGILLLLGPEGVRRGELSAGRGLIVWGLMLLGPGVAGPLLTGVLEGRAGLRAFAGRLGRWRLAPRWYALLLVTPLLATAALGLLSLGSPAFRPGIMIADNRWVFVALFVATACGACIEELGWTGFATPRLLARSGVLAAGLMVGALWAAWHFLADLSGNLAAYGALYPLRFVVFWLVALTVFRCLIVWAYAHTGSLLLAQLLHISYTSCLVVLEPTGASVAQSLLYQTVFVALLCGVVATLVLPDARRSVARSLRPRLA